MNYEKLAQIRKEKGLTHEAMAEALGYKDKSSYCLIENGKVKMTLDIMIKIIKILQLTDTQIKDIFFDKQVEETQTQMHTA